MGIEARRNASNRVMQNELTAKHKLATPISWKPREDVIVPPSVTDEPTRQKFPMGWKALEPYLHATAAEVTK